MVFDCVILVIASRNRIYDQLINVYWSKLIRYVKKHYSDSIKIYLLFGKTNIKGLQIDPSDTIVCPCRETYIPGILKKTVYGLDVIHKKHEYKYMLRTNLSSFFILDNLIKLYKTLPEKEVYGGVVYGNKKQTFVSGAAFWLSRDNVEYIIQNHMKLDKSIIDDVAIGILMNKKKKIHIPNRFDICHSRIRKHSNTV